MRQLKLFIDSSDLDIVNQWLAAGVIDGVTTNPTIMRRMGVRDWMSHVRKLAASVNPLPVSIQVTVRGHEDMISQASMIAGEIENSVVKIPIVSDLGEPNFRTISALFDRAIVVNATACLSVGQAVLAAKAGARYASVLWGRLGDEGGDSASAVSVAARLVPQAREGSEVIAASIRGPADVTGAMIAGAHAITIPPDVLDRLGRHHYATATAEQFYADAAELD